MLIVEQIADYVDGEFVTWLKKKSFKATYKDVCISK